MFDDPDLTHRLTLVALAAFSAAWVTALGAAVGSFLNVVIYRMPRRMSLVRPKSRCPACGASIRPGDNVPILGWLRLKGRCRDCGNPISPRYPFVEAATAILFLGLAHFELFSGGANLPGGPPRAEGLSFVLWHLRPGLMALYAYHAALLSTLLCLALIAYDGFPPPRRLSVATASIGLLLPLFMTVRPVVAVPPYWLPGRLAPFPLEGTPLTLRPGAVVEGLFDAVAGAIVASAVCLAVPAGPRRGEDRAGVFAVGSLVGLFLGAQAAVSCGLIAACLALVHAAVSRLTGRTLPVAASFATAAPVQILLWRDLAWAGWWPGVEGWTALRPLGWPTTWFPATSLAAATIVTAVAAWIAGRVAGTEAVPPAAEERPADEAAPAPSRT